MMLQHLQPFLGVGVDRVRHQEVAVGAAVAPPHPSHGADRAGPGRTGARRARPSCWRSARRAPTPRSSWRRGCPPRRATKPRITVSSSSAAICPCATPDPRPRAPATAPSRRSSRSSRSGCGRRRPGPPRSISRAKASSSSASSHGSTNVRIGERSRGRRLDQGQVAESGEREMERAGDRRGGEREHVHRQAERLEPFLVLHAEAVLLVHDQQPEVLELHVSREQPMRADHDVDLAAPPVARAPSSAPVPSGTARAPRPSPENPPAAPRRCARAARRESWSAPAPPPACRPAPP